MINEFIPSSFTHFIKVNRKKAIFLFLFAMILPASVKSWFFTQERVPVPQCVSKHLDHDSMMLWLLVSSGILITS